MEILNNSIIQDRYDVIVVGAGIGGITAAALLAKRGLKVLAVDQHFLPGGCVSHVRRQDVSMDVGAAMLFGFSPKGYKVHRFVMNELEEEIDMILHESIYRLHVYGKQITFWRNFEKYFSELVRVFPHQENELRAFYNDLYQIYDAMVAKNEMPMPPSEMPMIEGAKMFFKNPIGTMQLGMMMFRNTEYLVNKHITDPKASMFFDILTGTFACTNISESPAALAAAMFVDIHEGGASYPSGDPQMLPNKIEKSFERWGGQIVYRHKVEEILIFKGKAYGVRLDDGTEILADRVVYNGTVWNLYGQAVRPRHIKAKRMEWAQKHIPTLSAIVLYIGVDAAAIPPGARAIEMFIEDPNDFGGENFAVYIPSMDDPSICPPGQHSITVIAPIKDKWPRPTDPEYQTEAYRQRKQKAADRILGKMEKAFFPDFRKHIRVMEIATPSTLERFTLKNWGNVGGPKQMMGQEMLKRLKAKSEWENLYCCGDSTVMGEGVVAATSSGVGAANMVLRDAGLEEYLPRKFGREYVNLIKGQPWTPTPDPSSPINPASAMRLGRDCQHCQEAKCQQACPAGVDALNFVRRIETGNFTGAVRSMRETNPLVEICGYICPAERFCQKECQRLDFSPSPVRIRDLHAWAAGQSSPAEGWDRRVASARAEKVGVVGSGPAGLSCAHFLARLGYQVDILEKKDQPGGMLNHAIPLFRLPAEVVQREITGLSFPGINFLFGQELGVNTSISDLAQKYPAVFLAPGLWAGRRLDLPGREKALVVEALPFLTEYRAKGKTEVKNRVLVIGGGSVAADAALAAKKSGAVQVIMACLEKETEMPALPGELAEARKQGIQVQNCWGPQSFLSANKLSLTSCTSVFDSQGKFCPAFDKSRTTEIEFDQVIMAVGQTVDPSLASCLQKEFGRADRVLINETSLEVQGRPGIYAGGDIVRGAGTVVQAVADGRRAAMAIHAQFKKSSQ